MKSPSYAWVCHKCGATNSPGSDACTKCGFPALATGQQIKEEKSLHRKVLVSTLSQTENKVLMTQARQALTGNWDVAVCGAAICWLLPFGISFVPKGGDIVSTVLDGVLALGLAAFSLSLSRGRQTKVTDIFDERFGISLGAYLVQGIFIILWSLLLIVPGIIAAYSYSLTNYILVEKREIGILEAIAESKELMRGNKWKLACLQGRFIGWAILCLITFGIGFLWLFPYMMASYAKFYDDIMQSKEGSMTVAERL